ncbi:MAG: RNA polymerase sigma factor, partial [Limisphaerales bacterium]
MKTDQELIREFVRSHAEEAFSELVNRHIGLVYGAALRETKGNEMDARDVTQLVFIELARKAGSLQQHPTPAGWLYSSVRFVWANLRRAEQRRLLREREAYTMSEQHLPDVSHSDWEELKPVLDDAMHELNEEDRTAVILRFFEGRPLREVGDVLRLSENSARMRVERALSKL